ncbi:hypothetical protein H5410_053336 [Solanum commersonii]|uniref:Uncharacterized protein n=1 Tax=Solanum commersonii TaxID=4109 RepID=A0A9J5X5M5_SOLCO|nr:hypothetical protein H5410_053336 [Solanum commersonii]
MQVEHVVPDTCFPPCSADILFGLRRLLLVKKNRKSYTFTCNTLLKDKKNFQLVAVKFFFPARLARSVRNLGSGIELTRVESRSTNPSLAVPN